jgi:hypothetical protein
MDDSIEDEGLRKRKLNVHALGHYGTVEFRQPRSSTQVDEVRASKSQGREGHNHGQ